MTSKLDTAGLVERGRYMVGNPSAWDAFDQGASDIILDLIGALTQAAAPDMTPVAWRCHDLILPGDASIIDDWEHAQARMRQADAWKVEPLYSASQLSALQERAERAEANFREMAEKWRLASIDFDVADARAEAAEARVAELEAERDLIIEEASKNNAPFGRSDSGSLVLIRRVLGLPDYPAALHQQDGGKDAGRAALAHKGEGRS